jgi:hypothetical protein
MRDHPHHPRMAKLFSVILLALCASPAQALVINTYTYQGDVFDSSSGEKLGTDMSITGRLQMIVDAEDGPALVKDSWAFSVGSATDTVIALNSGNSTMDMDIFQFGLGSDPFDVLSWNIAISSGEKPQDQYFIQTSSTPSKPTDTGGATPYFDYAQITDCSAGTDCSRPANYWGQVTGLDWIGEAGSWTREAATRVPTTSVPEPPTFLLLAAGLAGIGLARRRALA